MVREYVYVFAAVCASLGCLTTLILPMANTQMMSLFLAHVAEEFAGYFIVMLLDRAGWHMAKRTDGPREHSVAAPAGAQSGAQPGRAYLGRAAREESA